MPEPNASGKAQGARVGKSRNPDGVLLSRLFGFMENELLEDAIEFFGKSNVVSLEFDGLTVRGVVTTDEKLAELSARNHLGVQWIKKPWDSVDKEHLDRLIEAKSADAVAGARAWRRHFDMRRADQFVREELKMPSGAEINEYNVNSSEGAQSQYSRVPTELLELPAGERCMYVIQGDCGSGKTRVITEVLSSPRWIDKRVLFITSRIIQAYGLEFRMHESGLYVQCYKKAGEIQLTGQRVICSMESLERVLGLVFDMLVVDESELHPRQLMSPTVFSFMTVASVWGELLRNTPVIVAMDAMPTAKTIEHMQALAGSRVLRVERNKACMYKRTWHFMQPKPGAGVGQEVEKARMFEEVQGVLREGKKLFMYSTSRTVTHELAAHVGKELPEKRLLVLNADTDDATFEAETENPGESWPKYDAVLGTSRICVAADCSTRDSSGDPVFSKTIVWVNSNCVGQTAFDLVQAVARARPTLEVYVYGLISGKKMYRPTKIQDIRQMLAAQRASVRHDERWVVAMSENSRIMSELEKLKDAMKKDVTSILHRGLLEKDVDGRQIEVTESRIDELTRHVGAKIESACNDISRGAADCETRGMTEPFSTLQERIIQSENRFANDMAASLGVLATEMGHEVKVVEYEDDGVDWSKRAQEMGLCDDTPDLEQYMEIDEITESMYAELARQRNRSGGTLKLRMQMNKYEFLKAVSMLPMETNNQVRAEIFMIACAKKTQHTSIWVQLVAEMQYLRDGEAFLRRKVHKPMQLQAAHDSAQVLVTHVHKICNALGLRDSLHTGRRVTKQMIVDQKSLLLREYRALIELKFLQKERGTLHEDSMVPLNMIMKKLSAVFYAWSGMRLHEASRDANRQIVDWELRPADESRAGDRGRIARLLLA